MRVGTAVNVGVGNKVRGAGGTRVPVGLMLGVSVGCGVRLGGSGVCVGVLVGKRVAVTTTRVAPPATAVTGRLVGLGVIVEPSEAVEGTIPAKVFGEIKTTAASAMTTSASNTT